MRSLCIRTVLDSTRQNATACLQSGRGPSPAPTTLRVSRNSGMFDSSSVPALRCAVFEKPPVTKGAFGRRATHGVSREAAPVASV